MMPLRIVLASFGPEAFSTLHTSCEQAGHTPVAYVYGRSLKPRQLMSPGAGLGVERTLEVTSTGMDILLPGSAEGLAACLPGYRPDLLVTFGFPWKIPESVLCIPRFGAVNIHPSALPEYRGPAPILWAIRNGDPTMGLTIHRMDENIDTGRILAQREGLPLEDGITPQSLWKLLAPAISDLLETALPLAASTYPGEPQDDSRASYAGRMEPRFSIVDWSHTVREIHNQVRTFRFIGVGQGPAAYVNGGWIKVLRTQPVPTTDGVRVKCADGPLWITDLEPVDPPSTLAPEALPNA